MYMNQEKKKRRKSNQKLTKHYFFFSQWTVLLFPTFLFFVCISHICSDYRQAAGAHFVHALKKPAPPGLNPMCTPGAGIQRFLWRRSAYRTARKNGKWTKMPHWAGTQRDKKWLKGGFPPPTILGPQLRQKGNKRKSEKGPMQITHGILGKKRYAVYAESTSEFRTPDRGSIINFWVLSIINNFFVSYRVQFYHQSKANSESNQNKAFDVGVAYCSVKPSFACMHNKSRHARVIFGALQFREKETRRKRRQIYKSSAFPTAV